MRIDLDEWAKEYAKRKKKDKRKSPMAKLHGLYKGKIFINIGKRTNFTTLS